MFPQIVAGQFGVALAAAERCTETLIVGDQAVRRLRPHEVRGPQVDGEETGRDFRAGLGIGGLRHQHHGDGRAAVMHGGGHGVAFRPCAEELRGPDGGAAVQAAVAQGRQGLALVHVAQLHVIEAQAQSLQPGIEGIVGRSAVVHIKGLALDARGIAQDVGEVLPGLADGGNGAVAGEQHGIAEGFVIGDADDGDAEAQVPQHGRQGPHAAEDPFAPPQAVQHGDAGSVELHLHVKAGFLVPAFFLGQPHDEGLVFVQPARRELLRFGCRRAEAQSQRCGAGHEEGEQSFQHNVLLGVVLHDRGRLAARP